MDFEVDPLFLDLQDQLVGRYSLDREIGRGGTGVVYLAREVRLDRLVAIKVLHPELAASVPARNRFLDEARTAARLSHPHIVPILTVEEQGTLVFFTMPYVAGGTLAERVTAFGPVAPPEAARMLRETAWALAYSHGMGIVHRDIKPGNILLERQSGRVLLGDFGIASVAGTPQSVEGLVGTPAFMSPEQIRGQGADCRSDLYALGIVGYYALSGVLPFDAPTREAKLRAHLEAEPLPLRSHSTDIPVSLADPIMQCLRKNPSERYQSAEDFSAAVTGWVDEQRPMPAAVRRFIDTLTESKPVALLYATFAALLLLVQIVLALEEPWRMPSVLTLAGVLALPVYVVMCARVRRLLASGSTYQDLLDALEDEARRQRLLTPTESASGMAWKRPVFRWSVIFAVISGLVWLIPGGPPRRDLLFMTNLVTVACAVVFGDQVLAGRRARGRLRLWSGPSGRSLFALAGIGVRRPKPGAADAGQRTEVAIHISALALLEELPKETQRSLSDVRSALERLERDARAIRARQHEVRQLKLQAPDSDLVHSLSSTEQGLDRRYSEVIAALENIRLGLLRLRAGRASPEGLTTDLGLAGDLETRLGNLAQANQEISQLLA